ncbi:hypothetical protein CONPUDRAFT_164954 [Coniophora puteana RWD-64-598 SS2]|uniref:DH domain-containing protein n=1 Tax=Coniophora puteana (strain RWD-64-598) TaxID=741705 RepID=A0A5M3MTB4_CONPW|nr:uncharacterized protein CONPUDRAFT_164954 [Coniophora puteana RWD-64-598 SS2]EIW82336.1 hypothetical protein CONPUDRAFT_164954 [Coniophora puteana RWD-64-598 SS2]
MMDMHMDMLPSQIAHSLSRSGNSYDDNPSPRPLLERRSLPRDNEPLTIPVDKVLALTDEVAQTLSTAHPPPSSRSPLSHRPFAPLTPILASPLTTPATSVSANASSAGSEVPSPKYAAAASDADYLNPSGRPDATLPRSHSRPWVTPTWTSTPPTPPPKESDEPSDPPTQLRPSIVPSNSLPETKYPAVSSSRMHRRASLPPMSTLKPLPPTPPAPSSTGVQMPLPRRKPTLTRVASPLRSVLSGERAEPLDVNDLVKDLPPLPSARTKPLFHFSQDELDKDEDEDGDESNYVTPFSSDMVMVMVSEPVLSDAVPPSSFTFQQGQHGLGKESSKRFHSLVELLSTEVGYLLDLKILVGYLRVLPTMVVQSGASHSNTSSSHSIAPFSRTGSSAIMIPSTAPSRANSASQLATDIITPHPTISLAPPSYARPPRHIFSASDVDVVTRNAEDLLKFHEHFVGELKTALSPLGLGHALSAQVNGATNEQLCSEMTPTPEELDEAIQAVCRKFMQKTTSFELYRTFCSGHSTAADIVRNARQSYPAEWEGFEQKSALTAAELRILISEKPEVVLNPDPPAEPGLGGPGLPARTKRRHSISCIESPTQQRSLSKIRSNSNIRNFTSASECDHSAKDRTDTRPQLSFQDYMIKPVQRLCKYPLLLNQLQKPTDGLLRELSSGNTNEASAKSDVDSAVTGALLAMRSVASSVDEARRLQDLATRSNAVVTRILYGASCTNGSNNRARDITPPFLTSLGSYHLAGPLDVVHHNQHTMTSNTIRAKYMGAFLYRGGYLVLVKVLKPKAYEPRHWLSLVDFEMSDSATDETILPSWFRLSYRGHHFEFAASCRREKEIWVDAIKEAASVQGSWVDEPQSSLLLNRKNNLVTLSDIAPEAISTFANAKHPESDNPQTEDKPMSHIQIRPKVSRQTLKSDSVSKDDPSAARAPSRRSSTLSTKSFFNSSPDAIDTIHLVRSTASARDYVNRCLSDVTSSSCIKARLHAYTHEEELFPAQRITRSFSKSSTGLAMANAVGVAARNKLTKRESVLVPRRRSVTDHGVYGEPEALSNITNIPTIIGHQRRGNKLRIVSMPRHASSDDTDDIRVDALVDSPKPMSQCSSSMSTPVSPLCSPGIGAPLSAPPMFTDKSQASINQQDSGARTERRQSVIDNFRSFFHSRDIPQVSHNASNNARRDGSSSSGLFRLWARESLRRRVKSAPEPPADDFRSQSELSLSPSSGSRADEVGSGSLPPRSESVAAFLEQPPADSSRRRFSFSSSARRRSLIPPLALSTRSRRDSSVSPQRNSFLSRLNSITPSSSLGSG